MVTSALNLNTKCCFDFGNAETNSLDNDKGHMDAINVMCQGVSPCAPMRGWTWRTAFTGVSRCRAGQRL